MDIPYISISRGSVFKECTKKYDFRYIKKIPEPVSFFYLTYGTIIHLIAELYVQNKGDKTITEIANSVLNGEIPLEEDVFAPPLPEEYKKKLPKHLKAIESFTEKTGFDGMTEETFLFDLEPPNNKNVKGVIDRLFFKGDFAFIVDYKTTKEGRYQETQETISKNIQLRTYCAYVQEKYNIPAENIRSALLYLEGNKIVGSRYSQESLDLAKQELLRTYNRIEQMPESEVWGNVGSHCQQCSYKTICPFFAINNNM